MTDKTPPSLRQLAKGLGVSHAFLSQVRNGKRPLPSRLWRRVEALDAYHLLTSRKRKANVGGADAASGTAFGDPPRDRTENLRIKSDLRSVPLNVIR